MMDKIFCNLCRFKRRGASLVNVCVFFLAATMITAQVFFFSTTTSETLAEEAKSVERRFSMGQKLQLAFTALEAQDKVKEIPASAEAAYAIKAITGAKITKVSSDENNYESFDKVAKVWSDDSRTVFIYDLNYTVINNNGSYNNTSNGDPWNKVPPPQRIFPPTPPDAQGHYFLVRVTAPGQGLGKKLMYQVLTRRSVRDMSSTQERYTVEPLTFQEVWYE